MILTHAGMSHFLECYGLNNFKHQSTNHLCFIFPQSFISYLNQGFYCKVMRSKYWVMLVCNVYPRVNIPYLS